MPKPQSSGPPEVWRQASSRPASVLSLTWGDGRTAGQCPESSGQACGEPYRISQHAVKSVKEAEPSETP